MRKADMMDDNGWIDASERKPTKRDADLQGCVLAWHRYNGAIVTGWHQFWRRYYGGNSLLTHWQRLPEKPAAYRDEKQ